MKKRRLHEMELRHEIWILLAESNHLPRRELQGHGDGNPVILRARRLLKDIFALPTTDLTNMSDDFIHKFRVVVEALRQYRNGMNGEPARIPVRKIKELSESVTLIDEGDLPF